MKLSNQEILKGSKNPKVLKSLFCLAERAHKTWEEEWSPFIEEPLIEEALSIFDKFSEINCHSDGGYLGAERQKLLFQRIQEGQSDEYPQAPIKGLAIQGNFLFDKPERRDFLKAIYQEDISAEEIGDLWIIGDRGAQLICSEKIGGLLNKKEGLIRDVKIKYELLEINQLNLPIRRLPKKITTVESSKRLDAIASAGFGLSRAKTLTQIKAGRMKINWVETTQANRPIKAGDQIQLEGKGKLVIESIHLTKRERWRVVLQRK